MLTVEFLISVSLLLLIVLASYAVYRHDLRKKYRVLLNQLEGYEQRMLLLDECARDLMLSLEGNSEYRSARREYSRLSKLLRAQLDSLSLLLESGSEDTFAEANAILEGLKLSDDSRKDIERLSRWHSVLERLIQLMGRELYKALIKKHSLGGSFHDDAEVSVRRLKLANIWAITGEPPVAKVSTAVGANEKFRIAYRVPAI